jgi:hypothetical protein
MSDLRSRESAVVRRCAHADRRAVAAFRGTAQCASAGSPRGQETRCDPITCLQGEREEARKDLFIYEAARAGRTRYLLNCTSATLGSLRQTQTCA